MLASSQVGILNIALSRGGRAKWRTNQMDKGQLCDKKKDKDIYVAIHRARKKMIDDTDAKSK